MGKEDKLLRHAGRHTGMKVPEGYFEDFVGQMMDRLPEYPERPVPQQLSRWQRIKPYVYMAAMFAGIWCMMKMFHIASQNAQSADLDNPPQSVVLAMDDSDTFDYFYEASDPSDDISDFEIEEAVSNDYSDMRDFEKDFGFEIRPEYQSLI
ncbi:MAG: hypothetical protein HDS25_06980 [Bacteroides sp.]|nr:hypothetical protein [Bacteroidales bacterium]MBD5296042.1 hypothetical protein [Bacteroides sp.]MDE6234447.1 hypothetical protein [Muribaculaceae bacterium]